MSHIQDDWKELDVCEFMADKKLFARLLFVLVLFSSSLFVFIVQ